MQWFYLEKHAKQPIEGVFTKSCSFLLANVDVLIDFLVVEGQFQIP